MSDRFVTESQLEEQKKKRQEEWEKVRTEDQPKEAPEPDYDPRSLYDRLKTEREKTEAEKKEAKSLKNLVRGLDSEEAGFLDFVDNMKTAELKKREQEEKDILSEIHKTVVEVPEVPPSTSQLSAKKRPAPPSRQAQLLGVAIKRKSSESAESEPKTAKQESNTKSESASESTNHHTTAQKGGVLVKVGTTLSAMKPVAALPGLDGYRSLGKATSDSDSDSDDSNSSGHSAGDMCTSSLTGGGATTATMSNMSGASASSSASSQRSSAANKSTTSRHE